MTDGDGDFRGALELLRRPRRAYLAFADVGLARRVGGLAFALPGIAALALIALEQPFRGGSAGIAVGILLGLGGIATGVWVERTERRLGFGVLSALAVSALVALSVLGWLAADGGPYADLAIVPIVYVAAVDAWWVALAAIGVAALGMLPGLHGDNAAAAIGSHLFVWTFVATLALCWTAGVRLQRRAASALARVDPLTGLGNRRAFDEAAATELARARRAGRPLSLLVGDLDDFKTINDHHGHLAGDECLRSVGEVLAAETRRPDACFRWGGDEFVVLLPEADLARARRVADRLAAAVAGERCRPCGKSLSLAFGAAQVGDELHAGELVARADADLLSAKALEHDAA